MTDFDTRDYSIATTLTGVTFEQAEARTRQALSANGFGVLTEIDVKATMKKKLDNDMLGYKILGACSPRHAWEAINAVPSIGLFLPCNVVLAENEDKSITVAAINAKAMFTMVDDSVAEVANEVYEALSKAIEQVNG